MELYLPNNYDGPLKNKQEQQQNRASTGGFATVWSKTTTSQIYIWLTAFSTWKTGAG